MALSIKDPETERLAREQAAYHGISITEAIRDALRERAAANENAREKEIQRKRAAVNRLVEEIKKLPVYDTRSPEEMINEMWEE